jgi:hypothetical protein
MLETRTIYRTSVGKPEGKRPLGRPKCRWVNNIKINLIEIGRDDMDWIWLRIGTSGGLCEHCNEPSGSIKRWEIPE